MLDKTRAYGLDFLFPVRDQIVGASLRQAGEFARPEWEIIARLLLASETGAYVDVGANIGSIALPVAATCRHHRVVAVEANRHLATILAANALGNGLANVDVIHAAAGAQPGLIPFPMPPLDADINFGGLGVHAQLHPDQILEHVRLCTLDEIAPADTRVVKLDVEGYEEEVLAGGSALFARRQASWIIEHKGDARAHAITQRFLDADYALFWLFAPFVTPNAAKRGSVGTSVAGDTNLLAIPHGDPPVSMARVTAADQPRPTALSDYPYLIPYGFSG